MIEVSDLKINAVIIDMDGVLWRRNEPVIDIPGLFNNFTENSIRVTLATNNAMNSAAQFLKKLASFGVRLDASQAVTSAMAAAYLVHQDFPDGGPVYMRGSTALADRLIERGFYHSSTGPQAVIAGIHTDFGYESVKEISLIIQKGVPFYYTNPDPTYPAPEGNLPGAGTILAALETASGVKAKIAGKPKPYLFNLAMDRMKSKPEETLVVGDRLNTDILGGYNAGCKTLFVLSGINTLEDLDTWQPKPDLVLDNISNLFNPTSK
jgi:4-nitrophenyl phosphatase